MKNFDIITGGNLPEYINLSNESTEEAIESSKLCESVRIKIENLTPGVRTIPVRYIENIENLVAKDTVNLQEYFLIEKIYSIISMQG